MSRARHTGLMNLSPGPIAALLNILESPAVGVLPHPLRRFDRRALLGLADIPALNLSHIVSIEAVAVIPLTIAYILSLRGLRLGLAAALGLYPAIILPRAERSDALGSREIVGLLICMIMSRRVGDAWMNAVRSDLSALEIVLH